MGMNQSRLGNYELQERLGAGVVGEVWKAFDTQQRHYVAIKIIPINAQAGGDFASRFYREGQILATLHHPNIVPVQNFRIAQGENEAYIITDYVEGPSLIPVLLPPPKGLSPAFARMLSCSESISHE
jgi:eukaryotic-like serine/threonine-protein kinase